MSGQLLSKECPFANGKDERKSAALATMRTKAEPGSHLVDSFDVGREILRSPAMKQAGLGADQVVIDDPTQAPVFFLDGEDHRRKRAAIARFFNPKAIAARYRTVMEDVSDRLLDELRAKGRLQLDQAAWSLAVCVAGEVVGLTNSDKDGMARRIEGILSGTTLHAMGPIKRLFMSVVVRARGMHFFWRDVRPAIRARRAERQEDIISHLLDEGYSEPAIMIECMTYSAAGMATTREFIVMVAWHLFEKEELRNRYLEGSEEEQFAILEEILRLEPVATLLYRRSEQEIPDTLTGKVEADKTYAINLRSVNTDADAVGPCPYSRSRQGEEDEDPRFDPQFWRWQPSLPRCPGRLERDAHFHRQAVPDRWRTPDFATAHQLERRLDEL